MMEKLKDMLYEASDILLGIIIILVMSTVITWKVSDLLAYSKDQIPAVSAVTEKDVEDDPTDNDNETTLVVEQIPEENNSLEKEQEPQQDNTTPSSEPSQGNNPGKEITDIQVIISNGTPGIGIAKILQEKGLIEDTAEFITRSEELKLASKLRSGTFLIKSNASVDDMIYIITGQKK